MKPDFDKVLKLVIDHGEPKDCYKEHCSACDEINKAREFYIGKKPKDRRSEVNSHTKFKYILIDENTIKKEFYVKEKAMRFVGVADARFNRAIKNNSTVNGFRVIVEDLSN